MEDKNSCFVKPEDDDSKAMEVVEAWHEATEGDVLGSYSGTDEDCGPPQQDADDL